MTVFKSFFRVSRRYLWPVLMYIAIMVGMTSLISSAMGPQTDELQVTTENYRLAVLNEDTGDVLSQALVTFIGEQANIQDIGTTEREIRDALFWRDVDYVLRIPQGFGAQVLAGKDPQLETYATPNDYVHMYVDAAVNRFLGTLSVYRSQYPQMPLEELIDSTRGDLAAGVQLSRVDNGAAKGPEESMAMYYRYMSYSLLAAISSGMGMVLAVLLNKGLVYRNRASSLSETAMTAQLAAAGLLFSTLIWLVLIAFGVVLNKLPIASLFSGRLLWMLLASYLYMIFCMALTILITAFTQKTQVVTGVSNVISLGSSFLGGVFVPIEFLGPSVAAIGKAFPAYWYTAGIRALSDAPELNAQALSSYGRSMGVVVLMIAVLLAGALLVNKIKRQRGL